MTLGLLFSVAVCAFVLGVALHVALYAPTAALPPMWRNMTRYFLGVAAVLVMVAIVIAMAGALSNWQIYAIEIVLFAMTGLGVAIGYLAMDD